MNPEAIKMLTAIVEALAPLIGKMLAAGMSGGDPVAAVADEKVGDVITSPSRLKLAKAAARLRIAGKP